MNHRRRMLSLTGAAFAAAMAVGTAMGQPSTGAVAAFERVVEVMTARLRDLKLSGDPDRDFAAVFVGQNEDLIFLAKTQLEQGSDRQLRELAQQIIDERQRQIEAVRLWQVRSRDPDYLARPDQPPRGSGALNAHGSHNTHGAGTPVAAPAPPVTQSPSPPPAVDLPLVAGRIEKIDAGQAKVTIDHGPIPNLKMDSMTMVFRTQDPNTLKGIRAGDRVRFTADRVNGQISVIRIEKARR
jgi:Cu/Ag efflux protein CusF